MVRNNLDHLHLADHTMMVRRTHVLKTGFEYRGEELFRRAARFARGQMAFGGVFTQDPNNRGRTGDGMADSLLGLASGGNLGNQNGETAATRNFALYLQEDWRISRRLTLNLGLRWERFGPPSYKNSPVARFEVDFARQSFNIVRPRDERDCGCRQDNNDFAPRIGFAFQLTERTVVPSGFGLFYGTPDAISPAFTTDLSNTGTTNYPNRISSGVLASSQRSLDRWFDLAAFTIPAQYTYGNSGRNILFGPGVRSADWKVGKNFYFGERYRLEFRTEMFNFTNTPAFGLPNASVNLAQAGQIRSAGEPRRIQFGLKFVF